MSVKTIETGLMRAGERAAARRVAELLIALAEAAERVPGVAAAIERGSLTLAGRALRVRAWGSRTRDADERIAGLTKTVR